MAKQMTVNELVKMAHDLAIEKKWWVKKRSALEIHALIHTEISEATEAVREGLPGFMFRPDDPNHKPEGEAIELVDAVIRIADYFGEKKWDLERLIRVKMTYNAGRPIRHGGKKY